MKQLKEKFSQHSNEHPIVGIFIVALSLLAFLLVLALCMILVRFFLR